MRWASSISREVSFERAVAACAARLAEELGGGSVSLALAFITPHFAGYHERLYDLVRRRLDPEVFAGCSGAGVIGGGEEVEGRLALALVAASLPEVRVRAFRAGGEDLPDPDAPPDAWEELAGVRSGDRPHFVILADPFTARVGELITGLDYAFPRATKVGGLASGASSPGLNTLFLGGEVIGEGSLGLALSGDVEVDAVVAQGCRPVGEVMQVTGCRGNLLYELDGQPALAALQEMFEGLDARDRELARASLFVGLLMNELCESPGLGDFLVRNLVGVDPARGALAVGENLQEGMRLQLHVRDAETSAGDLRAALESYASGLPVGARVEGALLFSCLGRGAGLYGRPNVDTGLLRECLGHVPVGGFFCNGEIGPVAGETFLHGYTSSLALFRRSV